jgi:hypothetical protein
MSNIFRNLHKKIIPNFNWLCENLIFGQKDHLVHLLSNTFDSYELIHIIHKP